MRFCGLYTTSNCNPSYKYIGQPICLYLHFTHRRGILLTYRELYCLFLMINSLEIFVSNFISSKLCSWDGTQHSPNYWSKTQTTLKMNTRVFGMSLVITNACLPCYTIIYQTKCMAFYHDPGPYSLDYKRLTPMAQGSEATGVGFIRLYCSDIWQTPGQCCC